MVWRWIHVHQVGAHAGAAAVDHRCNKRNRNTGCSERDDGEGANLTVGVDVNPTELRCRTAGARVASIEKACSAADTLVGHEVRVVAQHEVVHMRNSRRRRGLCGLGGRSGHGVILA